jgi:hypothetical protein
MITVEESSHYQLGYEWDPEWFSMAGEAFGYVRHGIPSATRVVNDATSHPLRIIPSVDHGERSTSRDGYYVPKDHHRQTHVRGHDVPRTPLPPNA